MKTMEVKDYTYIEVENKRLGLKGVIDGGFEEPTITITDENGKTWVAGFGSNFHKEWKKRK